MKGFGRMKWFNSNFKNKIIIEKESLYQIESNSRALNDRTRFLTILFM